MKITGTLLYLYLLAGLSFCMFSCSKSGGSDPAPSNPCTGVTVTVNGTITNTSSASGTDGSISATATGGSGFTFSLNNGTFQSSGTFANLAAGTYTVTAKNSNGCSGTKQFTITAPNVCNGVSIAVSGNTTPSSPCGSASGSITASASGSTGFTFSVNNGTFQSAALFNNLAVGSYTLTAKDANGCTGSATVSVAAAAAGPLFTAVKNLMQANCVSCHNASQQEGGKNWTIDCNIVSNKDLIKARAVDNTPSPMPPTGALPQSEKDKITAWVNAGGRYTD